MEDSPSIETVYEAIYALYNQNTNPAEKQRASNWLNEMQKSVCNVSTVRFMTKKSISFFYRFMRGKYLMNCLPGR